MARPRKAPRQRLLDAAVKEFAAHGFAGARIDAIARRAGMNKQLVYHYFGSKQAIYEAVFEQVIAENTSRAFPPGEDRKYSEVTMEELRINNSRDTQLFHRLLMFEALSNERGIHKEAERQAVYDKLVERVRNAQDQGEIDPAVDPALFYLAVLSLQIVPAMLPKVVRLATGRDPESEEFLQEWGELLAQFVARFAPADSPAQ
ncbi:TetR/AcrR family transcriptional regulator [Streptomyces sp. NPDC058457]|uniref:TetR/AcrR family transcriptional regulator n=1 Tax=Streptomyces sp. NPDC058457 TaxID=3346507 RepID=UPI00365C239A